MGRVALAALVAVLAGCAQLLGIEDTRAGVRPDGGAGNDGATGNVSLRIVRMSIGAKVVTAAQDLTGETATYEIADASAPSGLQAVPATISEVGTWTAVIADGTPGVEFTLPDYPMQARRFYALPSRSLAGLYGWLEHPHPTPAPAGATLTVNVALDAAYTGSETYQLYTLGSWTARGITPPSGSMLGALQATFPFDQAGTSITGRPAEKITVDDALVVLRYVGNQLTGYALHAGFDQTGNDTVDGTMAAVAQDKLLQMTIHPGAVAARYTSVQPAMANVTMAYYLDAAPGYLVANITGPQLNAVPVDPTASGQVSLAYGNPFVAQGWNTIVTWATSASRTYTVGALPVTLYAAINQFVEPGPGLDLSLSAGLPTSISIDQMPLTRDGMQVTLDLNKAIDLAFVPDLAGATLSQIQLYELLPNAAGTALQYQLRISCTGTAPHFVVPPDAFVAGHTYTLRAISLVDGFPAAATGDLTMRALPMIQAYADSGVFTVVAQ
jgi:hypothetical protein